MGMKIRPIVLLNRRSTLEHQGQILPQGIELENIFQANCSKKKACVAILISKKQTSKEN